MAMQKTSGRNELMWKPILSNLVEANGEIRALHWRLHYLAFGELPEDCPDRNDASCLASFARQEESHPFDEGSLFASMERAYRHLNLVWNCRHGPEERGRNLSGKDADRLGRFPDDADFADLWPDGRGVKTGREMRESERKISISPVRLGVYMANVKLESLCYLIAKKLGLDSQMKIARPDGLKPEVETRPFTESDFVRWMRRVYAELNTAWNSRRDKTFVASRRAIVRRRCFPPDFARR